MPNTTETSIGGQCLCHNLRRATRSVTRLYDAVLAPCGLRAGQFSILAAVRARGPLPLGHLAEALAQERTTLTRNLRLLGARGFVSVSPGSDRRRQEVAITDAGSAALSAALPLWRDAQETMRDRLGAQPMGAILDELKHLADLARK